MSAIEWTPVSNPLDSGDDTPTANAVETFLNGGSPGYPTYRTGTDEEIPFAAFVREIGLEIAESEYIGRPSGKAWLPGAVEYRVTLRCLCSDATLTTPWCMGMDRDFDAGDVLDALRMDAETGESCPTLRDLISDFGMESFNNDINEAQRVHEACTRMARELSEFLGEKVYRDLLDNVQRL
jgi:hypothetical protein